MDKERKASPETPKSYGFSMPPEWMPHWGSLMSWPVREEAWLEGLQQAREGYVQVARALVDFERLCMVVRPGLDALGYDAVSDAHKRLGSGVELWEYPHDDSWIRDNGPTFLTTASGCLGAVNWRFNAWGEKYQPFDADDALAPLIIDRLGCHRFDAPLVLEGGSIHVDGEGTLLTTEECLLAPNRNPKLNKNQIEEYLKAYLGAEKVLWLPKGLWGDETDGHVDNVACFIRPGLLLMQGTQDVASLNFSRHRENMEYLKEVRDAAGRRLDVVLLPEPPVCTLKGKHLALSYINFYPVNGGLIVPLFGEAGQSDLKAADDRAVGILTDLFPGRKLVGIEGMKIIAGGGNVHCITQQIPVFLGSGGDI